jgi:hypothetical protein
MSFLALWAQRQAAAEAAGKKMFPWVLGALSEYLQSSIVIYKL